MKLFCFREDKNCIKIYDYKIENLTEILLNTLLECKSNFYSSCFGLVAT